MSTAIRQTTIERNNDARAREHYVVLGAGVAGLAAARELLNRNCRVTVIEKDRHEGGLARTVERDGFRFDIGGHRFHSNNEAIVSWLKELLRKDLLVAPRKSHIYFDGQFVKYPLELPGALSIFSPVKAAEMLASFMIAQVCERNRQDISFEDWLVKRYGRSLYDAFFRPYTEKVWGMPCTELSAAWASQRIGIPDMWHAIKEAISPPKDVRVTAISQFYYPRRGFGMFPEALSNEILRMGGTIHTETTLLRCAPRGDRFVASVRHADGTLEDIDAEHIVSTIPLDALLRAIPEEFGSGEVLDRFRLDYRDIMCVFIALNREQVSEDTWTYFPQQELIFARTHEPKNWSADMVPSQEYTSLAAEIFANRDSELWRESDNTIAARTVEQMHELGWIKKSEVMNHWVLRVPNAYPTYRIGYEQKVIAVKEYLSQWGNLHLLGRTGSFRYMNSDGVIEDVFRFLESVFPEGTPGMQLPVSPVGRWV